MSVGLRPRQRGLRGRGLLAWLKRVSKRSPESMRGVIALGGLGLVVVLEVPWLAEPMRRLGFSDRGAVTETVILFVLVSVFYEVRTAAERADHTVQQRHFADPLDVYPFLFERMKTIRHSNEKVIDVLGITLYTAWPTIGFRLGNGDLFYSVLSWQEDGKIGRDGYSYEFVSGDDPSPSAMALRGVFDSWFARTTRTPWTE